MRKYRLVRELLSSTGAFRLEAAPLAAAEQLCQVHDPDYVQAFLTQTLAPQVARRIGFPQSDGLIRRTLASVGGTIAAARDALGTQGWGGTLAGGTHHAFRAEGAGFCVFNDIAIAIRIAQQQHDVKRVSVVDLDVHQGDGTASIFENDPDVFTLSLHGRDNFPFRKQRSSLDVPLPDGTGDEEYLATLARVLPSAFEHHPDLIFFQSGVDALASDSLGRLKLTPAGMEARDRFVIEACQAVSIPVVVTLGGGYSIPPEVTAEAHAATYLLAGSILGNPLG